MEAFAGLYCGPPPLPGAVWDAWNLDPVLLGALAILALAVGHSRPGAASGR